MINLKTNQTAYSRSGTQKIASFLYSFDEKINQCQSQIEKRRCGKNACYSNYLFGKIPIFHFYESKIPILQIQYLFFILETIPVIHIR
jgi:hypothetical protein